MKFTQRGFGSAFFCHFKVSNLHKMTRPLNFVIKLSSPNDFFKGCIFALVTVPILCWKNVVYTQIRASPSYHV